MHRKRAGMDVASGPKESKAGKDSDEGLEIARFFHKCAYSQLVSLVDLLARHRPGIHHHRHMFVTGMLLEPPKHCQPIHDGHAMIEHDDTRLALRPITKLSFAFQTVEHFLAIPGHDRIAFHLRGIECALYKEDVIGVIFPEEYPAAMWHMVKV